MTRAEVLSQYDVNEHGIIQSPGKFEAEMLYVPALWDDVLNSAADDVQFINGETPVVSFLVFDEEIRREFPEIGTAYGAALEETSQGFVNCAVFETQEEFDAEKADLEAEAAKPH